MRRKKGGHKKGHQMGHYVVPKRAHKYHKPKRNASKRYN